jgi:hypothetical protein
MDALFYSVIFVLLQVQPDLDDLTADDNDLIMEIIATGVSNEDIDNMSMEEFIALAEKIQEANKKVKLKVHYKIIKTKPF